MSMSVGGSSDENTVMSNINTTPLVDVMLVLLIIFLITIPVITKTVPVALPKAVNIPTKTKPENITIAVRSEEHTSELQSPCNLVCRLLLEKKKKRIARMTAGHHLQSSSRPCRHARV